MRLNTTRSRLLTSDRRLWIAVLLGLAAALNLIQFSNIEQRARHNYTAVYSYETDDVLWTAIARDNSARRWIGPYYFLGEIFPYATIVIPEDGVRIWFPFVESVLSFGMAGEVIRRQYDPEMVIDTNHLEPFRISVDSYAPGAGSTRRILEERVAYFAAPQASNIVVVLTPDGPPGRYERIFFVDANLFDDETQRMLDLPP